MGHEEGHQGEKERRKHCRFERLGADCFSTGHEWGAFEGPGAWLPGAQLSAVTFTSGEVTRSTGPHLSAQEIALRG